MPRQNELVIIDPIEQSRAKETGIRRLRMGLWYNPDIPNDRAVGETLMKIFKAVGCNVSTDEGIEASPEGILPGQEIKYVTGKIFRSVDVAHIVISKASLSQPSMLFMPGLKGIVDASDMHVPGNIFMVPIKIDDTPMPVMLHGLTPLDLTNGNLREGGQMLLRTWQAAAGQKGY